ncbi:helix-turn-helix domain-containing protein [Thermobifida cellulosilytica]|uniref:helix-turn-helix domain-containing protein n=1 Tax=Thermobifida cellulosilytica TaxID=144786 RepID=UPI0018DBDEE7
MDASAPRPETLGQRIAAARKLAGLSQQELARRTNYSVSLVRAVEQAANRLQRRSPPRSAQCSECCLRNSPGSPSKPCSPRRALPSAGHRSCKRC